MQQVGSLKLLGYFSFRQLKIASHCPRKVNSINLPAVISFCHFWILHHTSPSRCEKGLRPVVLPTCLHGFPRVSPWDWNSGWLQKADVHFFRQSWTETDTTKYHNTTKVILSKPPVYSLQVLGEHITHILLLQATNLSITSHIVYFTAEGDVSREGLCPTHSDLFQIVSSSLPSNWASE